MEEAMRNITIPVPVNFHKSFRIRAALADKTMAALGRTLLERGMDTLEKELKNAGVSKNEK